MRLVLNHNLPFTTVTVTYQGQSVLIPHVLVDTGSASTILSVDALAAIQLVPLPEDTLYTIRGVGASHARSMPSSSAHAWFVTSKSKWARWTMALKSWGFSVWTF